MDPGCGGDDVRRIGRPAVEITRDATRLAGDELAGGGVPGVQVLLEVGVDPARCRPAQVDRRRTRPADVTDLADQPGDRPACTARLAGT